MDGSTLFDEYVQRTNLGPRVIGSAFPLPVAEEYDRYIRRVRSFVDSAKARLPRLTPMYADFVEHPAFNARAVPALIFTAGHGLGFPSGDSRHPASGQPT
jgi:hypothetical protein